MSSLTSGNKALLALSISVALTACGGSTDTHGTIDPDDLGTPSDQTPTDDEQTDDPEPDDTDDSETDDTNGSDPDSSDSDNDESDSGAPGEEDDSGTDDDGGQSADDPTEPDATDPGLSEVRIQAQDYIDYYDTTEENQGGAFRSDGVDLEVTTDNDGEYQVTMIDADEWLSYEVMLSAGTYNVVARVASDTDEGEVALSLDGEPFATAAIDDTGASDVWEDQVMGQITISSFDLFEFRIDMTNGGFKLNWFDFVPAVDDDGDEADDGSPDDELGELDQAMIEGLADGSARFSVRVAEQKDTVHLFARRDGAQDHVIIDLQGQEGAEIDNGDGTFTYQDTRENVYNEGELVEARFFTASATEGQINFPGPGEDDWIEMIFAEGAMSEMPEEDEPDNGEEDNGNGGDDEGGPDADLGALNEVSIVDLGDGSVQLAVRVEGEQENVQVFSRKNGAQDFVVTDLHAQDEAVVDNEDGTFSYQITRENEFEPGDTVEARFYTFSPEAGQVFYPGPGDDTWEVINYGD